MQSKFVFVTGGVMSGLGKGITTASIGRILQSKGYSVSAVKIDPYLNVDAGTMNPIQHGEVFVTEDGGEMDMDIGTYERFLGRNLTKKHNITTGQIYGAVIDGERRGYYLGKCVQIIPHITEEIKRRLREVAKGDGVDILMVEIGGTIGDIEGLPYLEAVRQMRLEDGVENTAYIHVSYLPVSGMEEQKTKPTQHTVQELRRNGIQPDFIVCRSEHDLIQDSIRKISLYCNVEWDNVISDPDCEILYEAPLIFEKQFFGNKLLHRLHLEGKKSDLETWEQLVDRAKKSTTPVKIGMVGKYTDLKDSYMSLNEALRIAGWKHNKKTSIEFIESELFEETPSELPSLEKMDGIVVPGGYGSRGAEGKIRSIQYALEKDIPLLGLCYGLQLTVVAHARNLGMKEANSTEIDPHTPYPVIDILPDKKNLENMGGTQRLGSYTAILKRGTKIWEMYGRKDQVAERHRHRWEVNPEFHDKLERDGMIFSGMSPDGRLVEFIEFENHNAFGTQGHPELKTTFETSHQMFDGFSEYTI